MSDAADPRAPVPRRRRRPRPPPGRAAPIARAHPLGRPASDRVGALAVFWTELRALLRDRRALFSAFVLPTLLYPVLFLSNSWIEKLSKETLGSREVRVACDLRVMPPAHAARLVELLNQEAPLTVANVDASAWLALGDKLESGAVLTAEERAAVDPHLPEAGEVLLVARRLPGSPPYALRTYFDGQTDLGNEAERRVRAALGTLERELSRARLYEVLGTDPARGLATKAVDVSDEKARSGATLGRFLPLVAIFVLLAGASYAALSAFAGEREGGTLETLLVQPVRARAVVAGKFGAVILTAIVTLVLNAGSVLVSLRFGLGDLPGARFEHGLFVDGANLLAASLLYVPATVFLCAVLCLVCGRARTFREGQQLLFPLLLVAIVPALPATQPDVRLDAFLAAVPICGPSLALRDALRGEPATWLWAWMFVAQTLFGLLALSRLAGLLDAERILQGAENEAEIAARSTQSRVALRYGVVGVFAVYVIGGWLQSKDLVWGLAATLWLVLLPLALLAARGTARRAREGLATTLGLVTPRVAHACGALLLAPGLLWLAARLVELQQRVLPMPSVFDHVSLFPAGAEPGQWAQLALVALSPAICEELFFRGAILSGLRRDLPAWRCALLQAVLFGAVHASIYRFVPTGILGAVLALVTLRSRSLWPAVILHGVYNALGVTGQWNVPEDPRWLLLLVPGALCFLVRPRAAVAA